MNSLEIKEKVIHSKAFSAAIKAKKEAMIKEAVAWSGQKITGSFDYHELWSSSDNKYQVKLGKFGKEFYSSTIKWQDGHKGNNPNDMKPTIFKNGKELDFDASFDHIFSFFHEVSKKSEEALRLLGCLMIRNAYLLDHIKVTAGDYRYCPPKDVVEKIQSLIGDYNNISIETYLHYLDAIALNEDVKYNTLGYNVDSGIGRKNNMFTYAHLIAVLLGNASISKLCSSFSRPPVGVSPIRTLDIQKSFPLLKIH